MNRYTITYTDASSETQTCAYSGYNAEHAEERFLDSMESEGGSAGMTVVSVVAVAPVAVAIRKFYASKS